MSVTTPPRLLDSTGSSLLRDEDSAISSLEELPSELFPPLFLEAFHRRTIETLKAMVQAGPFVCLSRGGVGGSLTCLMGGPRRQYWKHLMSCLIRRFIPSDLGPVSLRVLGIPEETSAVG